MQGTASSPSSTARPIVLHVVRFVKKEKRWLQATALAERAGFEPARAKDPTRSPSARTRPDYATSPGGIIHARQGFGKSVLVQVSLLLDGQVPAVFRPLACSEVPLELPEVPLDTFQPLHDLV